MLRYAALLLLMVSFPVVSFSQTEIRGSVFDAGTGETLPSATVLLEGTYRGTITNLDGQFTITVNEFPAILVTRYIGYESERLEVTGDTEMPIFIRMHPSVTEMEEITVTEKDPGLSIMEIVIARKQIWRESLKTYQVDAYTRQSLSNDSSIVSIIESSSIAYWDHERGHREVQLSRRQTSNISEDQNFSGVRYQPNFYDDNIQIAGYEMVGITHPNALRYYHFRLLETVQMDGKPVYKIEVKPRRQRQPTFDGIAWVLGRDYALLEVQLKPNEVVSFPPPIQDFDLAYSQQFSNYGGDYWLPVDMRVEGLIRIGMVGLQFPSIKFRQVSQLSDYKINTELPDSVYRRDELLTRADSLTLNENELHVEPIPLTAEELTAYETIDSTATLEEAFKPEGFLARMIETSEGEGGGGLFMNAGKFIPNGISPRARFNRMDGLHLGLNYERRFNDAATRIKMYSGYSFHSELWDYGTSINQRLVQFGNSSVHLFGGYENNTDTTYPSKLYSMGLSSILTILGGEDYFNYYRNEKIYSGLQFRRFLPRTDFSISANREIHQSFGDLEVLDYSIFGWHNKRRTNPLIENGNLHSLKMELGYNISQNSMGFSGSRQTKISAEFSDDKFGSDFTFTRLDFSLDWNFNTFYQRRLFANTIDVHISAGTSFGDLPLQRFGAIDGTKNRFTPFGSLRSRKFLPYAGSKYWLATAEHNFRTIPFELLGMRPLVDRGWGIILFGGAGFTDMKDVNSDHLLLSDGVHTELGVSLNSVFGIMRIDFAKRLDSHGSFIGISIPRYF